MTTMTTMTTQDLIMMGVVGTTTTMMPGTLLATRQRPSLVWEAVDLLTSRNVYRK